MSNIIYPIAVWQPTDEALLSLKEETSRLQLLYTQRMDYIEHVDVQTAKHIHAAVLVNDLLSQDLFTELAEIYPEVEGLDPDREEDDDLYEYDSQEEERQSKNMSRDSFKQLTNVYRKIQNICHPDKTPHPKLWEISVKASILAERCELTMLLVLYSQAKQLKASLDSLTSESSNVDRVAEYVELSNEVEAFLEKMEDTQVRYDNAKLYAHNRELFLSTAMSLALEDIEETLQLYITHSAKVSDDLIARIEELDSTLYSRVFKPKPVASGYTHTFKITESDDLLDVFNKRLEEDADETQDAIKKLFPSED